MEFTNYGSVLLTRLRFPEVAHSNLSMVLWRSFSSNSLLRDNLFSLLHIFCCCWSEDVLADIFSSLPTSLAPLPGEMTK